MDKKQDAKFSMYKSVLLHLTSNAEALAAVPAFADGVAKLGANIEAIDTAAQQQETKTSSITLGKNGQKESLVREAAAMAGILHAWAANTGNTVLKEATRYKEYELLRYKDDKLSALCSGIYNQVAANKEALAHYGVTDALLSAFQQSFTSFNTNASAPRSAITRKVVLTGNLEELFAATDDLLKSTLDTSILLLSARFPDYYKGYKANRRIVDSGSRKRKAAVPATPAVPEV